VYPPFARGGGYVLSGPATRALVDIVKIADTEMMNTPVEDAAIGFYMSTLGKLRRIHSTRWWYARTVHMLPIALGMRQVCVYAPATLPLQDTSATI